MKYLWIFLISNSAYAYDHMLKNAQALPCKEQSTIAESICKERIKQQCNENPFCIMRQADTCEKVVSQFIAKCAKK